MNTETEEYWVIDTHWKEQGGRECLGPYSQPEKAEATIEKLFEIVRKDLANRAFVAGTKEFTFHIAKVTKVRKLIFEAVHQITEQSS